MLITLSLSFCAVAKPVPSQPASVAFWYAEQPPLGELVQFDWVVFEPKHLTSADVHFVLEQG
ncbi:MAG: hypothetical protein R6V43_15185, partial [Halopseudomonas sp.]